MIAQTNWRSKIPLALLGGALLCLCLGFGFYLIYAELDRRTLVLLVLGLGLGALYVVEDSDNVKRLLRGRGARYGGNAAALVMIVFAILALLNFLSLRHSLRWDLTAGGEFSLSAQTVKILGSVKTPVKATAFFAPGDYGEIQAKDLLKEFRRHNDKIQYEFIDWDARPGDAMKYNLQNYPAIVIESNGRRQDVTAFTEQDLISGLFKVTYGEAKKVMFSAGHGEPDISGSNEIGLLFAREGLEASNYKVDAINLLTTPAVADDIAAIVVDAPNTPFHDQEKKVLKDYLDRGGKVMVLVAPGRTADLSAFLQPYGLEVGNGIAIDVGQSLPNQPYVPVVGDFPDPSAITRDLKGNQQPVLMPISTLITVTQQSGIDVTRLLATSDRSWLASDENNPAYREGDALGPLTIGVAVTADAAASDPAKPIKSRLVVFGNADFASNMALDAWPVNRQLFVNAVNWLTEEEELISIRPQEPIDRTLMLTGVQTNIVIYSSVLFLPLAVAVLGVAVWWNRR